MLDKLQNLISWGGGTTIVIIAIIVVVFGLSIWWSLKHRKQGKVKEAPLSALAAPVIKAKSKKKEVEKEAEIEETPAFTQVRGTGKYKAMVYCADGVNVDFTTIPAPLGNIHQFDTSCPQGGGGYIVKELSDGSLAAYDPRDVVMETEELPEWAWFAINCRNIVQGFWQVPNAWWKSVSMWLAAGVLLIVFICFLAVFGG